MQVLSARQRYNRQVMVLMAVYAVVLVSAVTLFVRAAPHGLLGYVAAVLPSLPLLAVFYCFGRYLVDEPDEYVRMLLVRQSLIATGLTLSAATVWGFLEGFDRAPHLDAYWWPTVWLAGLGAGACLNGAMERRAR